MYERRIPIYPNELYGDNISEDEQINEYKIEIVDPRGLTNDEIETEMVEDFFNLKKQNKETVGWINIPNVGYFPIMQHSDNSYYLTHNEFKETYKNGVPFLDKTCRGFKDVTLIYGHHFKDGKMFGGLEKYKQEDFYYNNDNVIVFDGKKFYYYQPFTSYLFKTKTYSIETKFDSLEERDQFIKKCYEDATYPSEIKSLRFNALFLQTCDYSFYDARLVLGFKLNKIKPYNERR